MAYIAVTEILSNEALAEGVSALASGVLTACGKDDAAALAKLAPSAFKVLSLLCDAGYEAPALEAFKDSLAEFRARDAAPTLGE